MSATPSANGKSNEIDDRMVTRINQYHADAERCGESMLIAANACGRLLSEAKRICGPGKWLNWLKEHFHGSQKTADLYMAIAGNWSDVELKLAESKAQKQISPGLLISIRSTYGRQTAPPLLVPPPGSLSSTWHEFHCVR